MVKKVLFGMLAFASLFATSCTNELEQIEAGNTSSVSFKVMTPAMESRAYSDGSTATVLQYAVYDAEGKLLGDLTKSIEKNNAATINGSTTVNLQLTTGNTYKVIFWAGADGAPYAVDFENKKMTVDYTTADKTKSNDENRDAFYKYHEFTVNGAQTETIELKRPFAQLNIGTADYTASANAGYTPTQSAVTVKNIYKTLDLEGGIVSDEQEVSFASAAIPAKYNETENTGEKFPVDGYDYLAMNYLLVGADQETIEVEYTYTDGSEDASATKTRTVGSVPVRRNYRTNIYGNLLTSEVDVKVEINPDFEKPDYEVVVWDGKTIVKPAYDEPTKTYTIVHPSELAWLAAAVNGTLPENRAAIAPEDFAGETFVLTEDVDLHNNEWTPIGNSTNIFKGTFDGGNHTISNLVVNMEGKSNAGLFGMTTDGEIKNLVVENAKVIGRLNVGVIAGTPYTSKYTNITVKGHVEVNGMAYVGGVGGKNAYANWTNITVEVDETSYVKANSVEDGNAYRTYVGGVVGFNGEGGHKFSNITSNIDVEGSTIDVGGLFGIAHYGNQFENCVCTGNVTITTDEVENALEMGGIAGVWNNGGADVVFTNCTFEGELSTPNIEEEVNFYNGGLVGKPYSETGKGKLIIDGIQYVSSAAELQTALDAATGEATICLGTDITGNITVTQKENVKIILLGEGHKLNGMITVDGKSATYTTAGLTVKDLTFAAETIEGDACIRLGDGNDATRYTCNVTADNCIFDVPGAVGIKSYTGGDKNLTIKNSTATTNAHSLVQAKGIDGILIQECKVYSKNGMNFNNSTNVTVNNCTADVKGYAVRFGESKGGTQAAEVYTIQNSTLKSACDDGDAVIMLRGTADYSTLKIVNTTIEGTKEITNSAEGAKVIIDGNNVVFTADELKAALADGNKIFIKGEIADETIKLPATLKNVTIVGGTLKNSTIMASDGSSINYEGLTFDGVTFENSRISITGWRTGGAAVKNLTVTNCKFNGLDDTTNSAPVHINMDAKEAVQNFTFTNNVIDGATGGSKSGVYAQLTGNVVFKDNVINNVSFRPYVIQIITDDGIADNFEVTGNTFSGSAAGRAQGLGNNAEGTDAVEIVVSRNIFKDITNAQQICYWNFNPATTTADLSKNYYDIDIEANPNKIYYNAAASSVEDLVTMGVYPFYTELNADGTIKESSLKQAQ